MRLPLIIIAIAALVSGCASVQDTQQQNAPLGASARSTGDTGPTVSGYISTGAGKQF
jgi:uncharacterized protein YceK